MIIQSSLCGQSSAQGSLVRHGKKSVREQTSGLCVRFCSSTSQQSLRSRYQAAQTARCSKIAGIDVLLTRSAVFGLILACPKDLFCKLLIALLEMS